MGGQEQTERLLLHRVPLCGIVLDMWNWRVLLGPVAGVAPAPARVVAEAQIEDRPLPELRILLDLVAGRLSLGEDLEHACACGAGRVERPALDQGLDRLLVHAAAVDALAEI